MVCTNRQIAQSDRVAAFSSNAAVIKQLRALPNHATPDQVKGWLQHELHPAVQHVRSRLNEAYPHYARNAPSGNPLYYLFKEDTAASDPQFGFMKLNQAVQNTSTVVRVSEKNAKLQSIIPWLTIMQGSGTSPLGVLTLADSKDPTRFIRFNLNSMIDQGTYWDLAVTPIESSTASPFVGGGETFVSFIPGVASGGVVPATTIPYLRAVSLVTLAASQNQSVTNATDLVITSGTVFLGQQLAGFVSSHSRNNVVFGASGNTLMGVATLGFIAGTRNVPAQFLSMVDGGGAAWTILSNTFAGFGVVPQLSFSYSAPRAVSAGTQSMVSGTLVFANSNSITFGMSGSSQITASFSQSAQTFLGALAAGTQTATSGTVVFSNSNDMSFGMSGSTQVTGSYQQQFGLVSHIGGNVVSSVRSLAFSNASNVTWSLSTAANAATVIASVAAAGGGGITAFALSNAASSVAATGLTFSNANGFSFLLSTGASAGTLSGSFAAIVGISAGTQSASSGAPVFSNSNNVSFGMSGSSRITASYALNVSAGASSAGVSSLVFTNTNNVGFAASTDANGATIRAAASIQISAGTTNGAQSVLSFANSNGVTFGLNASTITASVAAAAGGIGGIAANTDNTGGRSTLTSGTVLFRRGDTQVSGNFQSLNVVNVQFSLDTGAGTTQMLGFAGFNATVNRNATDTGGFFASKFQMSDGGGIQWGVSTTSNADGKEILFGASLPAISLYMNNGAGSGYVARGLSTGLWVAPFLYPMPGRITADTMELLCQGGAATGTPASYGWTLRGGIYTLANSTQLSLLNSFITTKSSTSQASSAWNNLFPGDRWITVHSSLWSSSPVFSAGVQYWLALVPATAGAGASVVTDFLVNRFFQIAGTGYRGDLGASHAAASSFGFVPFLGTVNTTGIPTTIGTAGIGGDSNSAMMPMFHFRQGIARGA